MIISTWFRNDGLPEISSINRKDVFTAKDVYNFTEPNKMLEHYQTNLGNEDIGYLKNWTRCYIYVGF